MPYPWKIIKVLESNLKSKTLEVGGEDILSFKEILEKLLSLMEKKRLLLPMPISLAKLTAHVFELLPKPLITNDQLKLLKYDIRIPD